MRSSSRLRLGGTRTCPAALVEYELERRRWWSASRRRRARAPSTSRRSAPLGAAAAAVRVQPPHPQRAHRPRQPLAARPAARPAGRRVPRRPGGDRAAAAVRAARPRRPHARQPRGRLRRARRRRARALAGFAVTSDGRIAPDDTVDPLVWRDSVERSTPRAARRCSRCSRRPARRVPAAVGGCRPAAAPGGWPLVSASPIPYGRRSATPAELDEAGMERVRDAFVAAARARRSRWGSMPSS